MKEFFKTKSPYENKEKTDKKQEGLLSSEKKSLLNSKTPSFFDNKESTTQKIPSFMSNDDVEAVAQGKKLAREAIDGNLRRGVIDSAFLQSHPNLFDGLSMFYAHSLSNNKNSKAANEAYKYAYSEDANKHNSFDTNSNLSNPQKIVDYTRNDGSYKQDEGTSYVNNSMFQKVYTTSKSIFDAIKPVYDTHADVANKIYDSVRKIIDEQRKIKTGWYTPVEGITDDVFVSRQSPKQIREAYLRDVYPKWIEDGGKVQEKDPLIKFYNENPSVVRYTGAYCLPIAKSQTRRITQGFYGNHSHAGKNRGDSLNPIYHYGVDNYLGAIDIAANWGTSVQSVLPGEVVYVGTSSQFHRVTVKTDIDGETYYLEYLHMAKPTVKKGDIIKMGTQVGTVGDVGSPKNIHLDFRVYKFLPGNEGKYNTDRGKLFFDPFEFFDFDVQYNYVDPGNTDHDYN